MRNFATLVPRYQIIEDIKYQTRLFNDGADPDPGYIDAAKELILDVTLLHTIDDLNEQKMIKARTFIDGFINAFIDGIESERLYDIIHTTMDEVAISPGGRLGENLASVCRQLAVGIRPAYAESALNIFLENIGESKEDYAKVGLDY
jgi:hypothetical protein